jgi:osmotically-inducible protein OsmY
VTVKDGVVTLTGEVDSLAARRAAERAARDIAGVRQVRNDLRVQTVDRSSAEQTAQAVVDALERDAFLSDDKIKVTVDGGTVQLRGDLDSSAEVLRAQEIASGIGGVVAVRNGLTVGGRSVEGLGLEFPAYYHPFVRTYPAVGFRSRPRTDAEIKDDIEDEMFWSPFVDGKKVAVSVENGIATLTGTVDTWGEHNAAIENAHEGGARDVRDQLKVRQGPADRR